MLFNPHPSLLVPDCPRHGRSGQQSQRRYEEPRGWRLRSVTSAALFPARLRTLPGVEIESGMVRPVRCLRQLPADS